MTIHEEIREDIAHIIARACYEYFNERTKAENIPDYYSSFNALFEADDVLSYLHDNGVVIKVDSQKCLKCGEKLANIIQNIDSPPRKFGEVGGYKPGLQWCRVCKVETKPRPSEESLIKEE